jgi:hypothetical protein
VRGMRVVRVVRVMRVVRVVAMTASAATTSACAGAATPSTEATEPAALEAPPNVLPDVVENIRLNVSDGLLDPPLSLELLLEELEVN